MTPGSARWRNALCALALAAFVALTPSVAIAQPTAQPHAPSLPRVAASDGGGANVWGFGVPGGSVEVRTSSGKLECTATVDALGSWECALSVPDCTITLSATLSVLPLGLTLPITIPKPFCTPQQGTAPPTPQPPHPTPTSAPGHSSGRGQSLPAGHPTRDASGPGAAARPAARKPLDESLRVGGVHVIAGAGSALATWSTAGKPAGVRYTATARPGGASCTSTSDRCLITGLDNGVPYRIEVVATTADARGPSVESSATTPSPDATKLALSLGISAGADSAGSVSTIDGRGLLPGSQVVVEVHSTPQRLGAFQVGADGTFTGTVKLPSGLAAGRHQLVATGTGLDGVAVAGRTGFSLTASGAFAGKAATGESGNSGDVAYPPYDPRDHPDQTIKTLGSAFALVMVAGGLGAIRRRRMPVPKPPRTRSGKKPSVSMSHQEFRAEAVEPGDRSRTWVSPFLTWFDKLGLSLPHRLNVVSPLLARLFNDAAYLRAMLGTWALLSPIAGLVLGALAAHQTGGHPLPPSNGLLFTILLWGIFDALAGFAAATAFTLAVVFSGGIGSAADLRALIALDVLFFAAILVVSATRDLRREPATNAAEVYDRLADFVVGAVLAMWTVKAAVGALPALTGLELPIADSPGTLVRLVGGATLVRFALETLAAHWYPERLLLVAPEVVKAPPNWRTWVAIATKLAAFVFFAISYMGNHWPLWVSAALMLVSLTMPKWKARFPDWPRLSKLVPGGIIGLLFYFLLGAWSALALKTAVGDPAEVAELGFFLLMLPGLICAALVLTARNGEGWKLTWFWRLTGIPMLVLTYLVVSGIIPVV